ncbi:MAG TPA: hypothetical protein VFX50_09185 [Gemmatimonadales bacterium]|nr:hypothetical protein [Gemmatimonadales bacterium]
MRHAVARFLRLVLAVALVGVGPVTRATDALVFHVAGAPAGVAGQVDDGSAPIPHGDACILAAVSSPAAPAPACGTELSVAPAMAERHLVPAVLLPETRAGRSPPSRAPPA